MIHLELKQLFFDRKRILTKVDAATRKVLSKFGAFVRQRAKSSIKRRKAAAPPGSAPSSHTGLLKKFIFFGYDAERKSVVIGPARLGGKGRGGGRGGAPSLLEYGGETMIKRQGKARRVNYQARPYMGPAFEKEKPKLPALWRNSTK